MGPIIVLIYAIGAGASAIAGEDANRTLDLVLVNPVSRRRVVGEKMLAVIAGVAVLSTALWIALVAEGRLAGMATPLANSAAALLHLGLLAVEFAALALLVGALTGRVGASRAVPATVATVAYIVNAMGQLVSWLEPMRRLSPFFQYSGHDPLRNGASLSAIVVSLLSTAVLVGLAAAAFTRRDVGT